MTVTMTRHTYKTTDSWTSLTAKQRAQFRDTYTACAVMPTTRDNNTAQAVLFFGTWCWEDGGWGIGCGYKPTSKELSLGGCYHTQQDAINAIREHICPNGVMLHE